MPELLECMYCGEEYEPELSDAPRPRDWCSAEHQRRSFAPAGEFADEDYVCVDGLGNSYPEHDFNEVECRRCGAEPDTLDGIDRGVGEVE